VLSVAVVIGCGLASAQAPADSSTRSVEGVVNNAAGSPVNKAVVQLKDTKTLQIRSFMTGDDGAYHFAGLSTNVEYELKAQHDGASSGSKSLGVYDSRKKAVVNLKLNK
jgi:hypothetical protein